VRLWLEHPTHQGVLTRHPYALSMPNTQRSLKQSRLSHAKEYLMFFLVLALFLLICGGLVVLTVQNLSTPVHLVFYSWHIPAVPVALWIVGAFLLGTLLLYLISVTSALDDRRELRKLRKRISELEEEKRRSLPLGPARVPTLPLMPGSPQVPVGPTKAPTGPSQPPSSFIPMPGMHTPPQNGGASVLPIPDSRQ